MSTRQYLLVVAFHAAITMSTLIGVTLLTMYDKLDGQAATAVIGAALGFAGGTGGTLAALPVLNGNNGKKETPSAK